MPNNKKNDHLLADIRKKAEKRIYANEVQTSKQLSLEKTDRLQHELQVYELELEMLNDELRRTQEKLEASRARYLHLFDMAPVGYLTLGKNGLIVEANLTVATQFGVARGDLLRQPLARFIFSKDKNIFHRLRKKLSAAVESQVDELRMVRADGAVFWVQMRIAPSMSDEYKIILSDITGRKRAEEELRQSETLYRSVVTAMAEGVVFQAASGKIVAVNAAADKITGRMAEQLIGQTFEDQQWRAVYEDGTPFATERFPSLVTLRTGMPQSDVVIGIHTPEGELKWLSLNSQPLMAAGETRPHAVVTTFHDVTERKRAERTLVEKETRMRILVETIPDLIWLKDAEGVYLTCNKIFEQFFGAKESDIVGKTDYDFVNKELADFFREHDRKAMAAGGPSSNMEWITFASDGHRAYLNTIKTPMYDAEGRLLGVLGIGRDITEYHKLEDQLRHAQKMESIGTLAGGIAHDFNNILSAIIGYGQVTLMDMPQDDPLRMNIENMLGSAESAASLTQSLLTFSRKQITERKPIDLNTVLKKVKKFLVRVIGEDVAVRMALAGGQLAIFADGGQLEQVFMNLATNARDAMPKGGSFFIESSVIELDNQFVTAHGYGKPGTYAMVTVTDTGEGMSEEIRKKIFEPFFTTKEAGRGTGLGLAMVYGIVKKHEGLINVYSEPGKGTTFRIYLPMIKAAAEEGRKAVEAECPVGGKETILLAEDDANLRKLTVLYLEQMGYTVITANDGEEAVRKFMENKDRIQLLLFDIVMPKKNGREAYEDIRNVAPAVPVIFASGYSADMLRGKSLIENGAALLYKPLLPQSLLKKVREILDR